MYKLIINQDVLPRTPVTQVRRHIDDGRPEDTSPTSTQEHDPDMYCTVSLR
jgi:hypothetical protein